MANYKVKIGYTVEFNIKASNKKEAEEIAWFQFDESAPYEPEIEIKSIKHKDIV